MQSNSTSFPENGTIVSCNDDFIKIVGSSRKALVGLDMKKLPDQKSARKLRKALAGSNGFYKDTYHFVTAKKSTRVKVYFFKRPLSGTCKIDALVKSRDLTAL